MMAAALPPPLNPDWTYEQALASEALIRAQVDEHGPSPEALAQLSQLAVGRCAYRSGTAIMHDALLRWPDLYHAAVGLNGRLAIIQYAIHGGLHDIAAHWVRDLATHSTIISAATATPIATAVRGTGLQPEAHEVLSICLKSLDPDSAITAMVRVLVSEYAEVAEIASQVRLVSLGAGCYGWLQSNRYMLRHVGPQDQLMPFNLAVTIEAGVVAALEDELAGFRDPSEFHRSTMIRGIPVARHRRYAMLLNHDCDEELLADGMSALQALCSARAAAFRDHATTGPRVYLCTVSDFGNAHRIERALAGLMRDDNYRLLLVADQHGRLSERPDAVLPTTRMVHLPVPSLGYNWHLGDRSPEGIRYDLAVRRAVLDSMREVV
ncbi:hypothetical protein [Plastoroseomonas hellenica]|uniref:hypothetical protein n=1 Tax=Plastoroseomonas hellenica TaxID=2687306 RepID=UPI001BADE7ED|nr:hypothetical protein [Plastoroseomonas hellenica]MBR0641460.1 hypothetical protein [Plastoroseomonas hellenica]